MDVSGLFLKNLWMIFKSILFPVGLNLLCGGVYQS